MPSLKISIQTVEDAMKGKPAIEDLDYKNMVQVEIQRVAILEAGMMSGKTSVMFHFVMPDGQHVIAETSADIMKGFHNALQGFEQRLHDQTYTLILGRDKPNAIHCKKCGLTSYNQNDVREKFCCRCGFHEL